MHILRFGPFLQSLEHRRLHDSIIVLHVIRPIVASLIAGELVAEHR